MTTPSSVHGHILAVMCDMEVGLATQDQCNPYTLQHIGLQLHSIPIATTIASNLQKVKKQDTQKLKFEKGSRDLKKSKETSSQLEPVKNSYVAMIHQPVIVSSNMQPNACTNKAFSSTSTKFNPYLGWSYHLYILYQSKQELNLVDEPENALFVHAFIYIFELTVTGWCIIDTQLFLTGSS